MKTIQFGRVALFAGVLTVASPQNQAIAQDNSFLTNGLVAYYPFNGNANDASGNGNNGIAVGVSPASDRFGNAGSCYQFAGVASSQSCVQIPNASAVQFTADFTVSVWIKFTDGSGTENPRVISTAGYEVATAGTSGNRPVAFNPAGINLQSNPISAGIWNHIVAVKAGNSASIYINGTLSGSATIGQPLDYSRGFIPRIGGNDGIDFDAFGGLIDDVRFYNRALSAQEISTLYTTESVAEVPAAPVDFSFLTNGLLAYYPLAGNFNDASGNGNNGTGSAVTLDHDRFGRWGMAYRFNGKNSFITSTISGLPVGNAPRTVALWAKSQNPSHGGCLLYWGASQNRESFGILNNSAPNTWQGLSWGGGDDVNSGVVVDANWHHVVVVYDGSVMGIFLDGSPQGALSIGIDTQFSPLIIGALFDASIAGTTANAQFFNGSISQVRIYNRALSAQEISRLYATESVVPGMVWLPTVTLSGIPGGTYLIQYTTNTWPDADDWTTLASNIRFVTSPFFYPDTNALNQPKRFYRVIAQ